MEAFRGELPVCFSCVLVDNLENAISASEKLGGVAGVFAGAHNYKYI